MCVRSCVVNAYVESTRSGAERGTGRGGQSMECSYRYVRASFSARSEGRSTSNLLVCVVVGRCVLVWVCEGRKGSAGSAVLLLLQSCVKPRALDAASPRSQPAANTTVRQDRRRKGQQRWQVHPPVLVLLAPRALLCPRASSVPLAALWHHPLLSLSSRRCWMHEGGRKERKGN